MATDTAGTPAHPGQPSISYSITVRLEVPAGGSATSRLTSCVEEAGGIVTALDVTASGHDRLRIDVTCAASDTAHADRIVEALRTIEGVDVHKVSDRTFLMHLGGTIQMETKHPIRNRDDLSMVYTPGVARVCEAIVANPEDARRLTVKRNSVAVVTDGSAVLGLGNIGPAAALPVMEGKAALFKRFAGIDAWPLCLDTQDPDTIVEVVRAISPGFAGINLEDISAPRCFEIERRLRDILDIPVFHDDQHGTAIVVLAALTNALRVVGKQAADVRIVMSGAGAAGTAILRLLLESGVRDIVLADIEGVIYQGRPGLDESLQKVAEVTNQAGLTGSLHDAMDGADVFIGVSAPHVIDGSDVSRMAPDAIVFALANPVPEIDPAEAREHAAVVATGRSDYPNQINNVLAFPGVFRGLLDAAAHTIDDSLLVAAAHAIASAVSADELNANYIIPSVFHSDVHTAVAAAVRTAAERSSRVPTSPIVADGTTSRLRCDPVSEPRRESVTSPRPMVGSLLVATPSLLDPNFERTVVLLLDSDDNGALGVVLNRPSAVPVGDLLPAWRGLVTEPDVLFKGGPVSTDSALAVGISAHVPGGAAEDGEPVGFRRLYDDIGLVDLDTPSEVAGPGLSRLRVFAGYAGWGEEQLIGEVDEGAWYVVPSVPGDLFATDPGALWATVLRRQPGELAWVSTRPADPTLN